jgi:hypothetical protein
MHKMNDSSNTEYYFFLSFSLYSLEYINNLGVIPIRDTMVQRKLGEIIADIYTVGNLNAESLSTKIESTIKKLSGLIDKESALLIIAGELGVRTHVDEIPPIESTNNAELTDFPRDLLDKFGNPEQYLSESRTHKFEENERFLMNIIAVGLYTSKFKTFLTAAFKIYISENFPDIGLELNKIDNTKNEIFIKAEILYPKSQEICQEIIFPFASFKTQLVNLNIKANETILVVYSGKKPNPVNPAQTFHSVFLQRVK